MWGVVVWAINPDEAGLIGFLFFYIALGFAVMGTYISFGFLFNMLLHSKKQPEHLQETLKSILKQSLVIGIGIVVLFLLLRVQLVTWWNSIILVALIILLKKTLKSVKTTKRT
jgi:amino acid permease